MHHKARIVVSLVFVVALLVGAFGIATSAPVVARGTTSDSLANHPVVGAWMLSADGEPSVTAFTSDGIVMDSELDGSSGVGSWNAVDESTAAFTLILLATEDDNPMSIVIRGTMEIDASGDTGTLDYSFTVVALDGTVYFSASGTGSATRIPVEGPELVGSPVAGFPVIAGTPAA